jgi:autotransporter-associated beta strand protein
MKEIMMRSTLGLRAAAVMSVVALGLCSGTSLAAVYWDNNGSTAGFGTASGTWNVPTPGDSSQGWSLDGTGGTAPTDYTTDINSDVNFGNGATGLSNGTVAVSSTVSASNITFASGSGPIVLSGAGTILLANTNSIVVNNASDTISACLAGATNSLTKSGAGILILSRTTANTYTGVTIVNAGTIQYDSVASVGNTSKITVNNGGTIYLPPTFVNNTTISAPIELKGVGGSFWIAGALTAYSNEKKFNFSGTITLLGSSQIKGFGIGGTLNFTGVIGGTGNLTFWGSGSTFSHRNYMVISGASTFNGDLYIEGSDGSAQVTLTGGDNRLPVTAVVHIGAGWGSAQNVSALNLNGNNQTLAGLSDSGVSSLVGNRRVVNTSNTVVTLTLNTAIDQSFSGTIGGADIAGTNGNNIALVKTGIGTQTLAGTNPYTGATVISNGALTLAATATISNSPTINVASGAVFNVSAWPSGYPLTNQTLAGNGSVTGSVVVAAGAVISVGSTNVSGALSCRNNLTLNSGSVVNWNYDGSTTNGINVAGTLTLPTVATVNVSRASSVNQPGLGVLFAGFTNSIATDLSGWVINGAAPTTCARVDGKLVRLVTPTGFVISVQ